MTTLRLGIVQLRPCADTIGSLFEMVCHLASLKNQGCEMVVFPEYALAYGGRDTMEQILNSSRDWEMVLSRMAVNTGMAVAIAGVPVCIRTGSNRNRTFVFDPQGELIAYYDKCHLFPVKPKDPSGLYEPDFFQSGSKGQHFLYKGMPIGLATCFDIRFSSLFLKYSYVNCQLVICSAAFNADTGRDHWHTLLRARAIEYQYYVAGVDLAAPLYGHSVVYSPWGELIGELNHDQEGELIVDIDSDLVRDAQARMPMRTYSNSKSD